MSVRGSRSATLVKSAGGNLGIELDLAPGAAPDHLHHRLPGGGLRQAGDRPGGQDVDELRHVLRAAEGDASDIGHDVAELTDGYRAARLLKSTADLATSTVIPPANSARSANSAAAATSSRLASARTVAARRSRGALSGSRIRTRTGTALRPSVAVARPPHGWSADHS